MKSTHYRKAALIHLSDYKRDILKCTEIGEFKNQPKHHVLPPGKRGYQLNLLPGVPLPGADFKYHMYAHHLNSSQMMCYNFFAPLLADDEGKKILLEVLREETSFIFADGANITSSKFEHEPDKEEATNFDLYLELSSRENIYFEIKYTEPEFGGINPDKDKPTKYEDKWDNVYREHLQKSLYFKHLIPYDNDEEDTKQKRQQFYSHYQINRNLSYIRNETDYCILLFPFDSDNLTKQTTAVLGAKESTKYPNATTVDWKAICTKCIAATEGTRFNKHYLAFFEKYLAF